MERLVEILVINSAAATLLAAFALAASRFVRRPAVVHVLWLAVLLKLLAPPVLEMAMLPSWTSPFASPGPPPALTAPLDAARLEALLALASLPPESVSGPGLSAMQIAARAAGALWLAGIAFLVLLTVYRSLRFRRLVVGAPVAPASLAARARRIAGGMGLRPVPRLRLVEGRVPPMLWPRLGPADVLLPSRLFRSLEPDEQDALIAHELAHFARKDHWVRYVETLAVAFFWWHPVTWWARRRMRAAEERCCDDLVVEALPGRGRAYAEGLLKTVEFLSGRGPLVPAVATGAGESRHLQERLTMIMNPSKRRRLSAIQRWLLAAGALGALAFFPTWSERAAEEPAATDDEVAAPESAEGNEVFFGPDVKRFVSPEGNEVFFGPPVEWRFAEGNERFSGPDVEFFPSPDGNEVRWAVRERSAGPDVERFPSRGPISLAPGATEEERAELARLRAQLRELQRREMELEERLRALEGERREIDLQRQRMESEKQQQELLKEYERARTEGRLEEAQELFEAARRMEREAALVEERHAIEFDLGARTAGVERALHELALEAEELEESGEHDAARDRRAQMRQIQSQLEMTHAQADERMAALAYERATAEYERALAMSGELEAAGRQEEARRQYEAAVRMQRELEAAAYRRSTDHELAATRAEMEEFERVLRELHREYEAMAAEGDEAGMQALQHEMQALEAEMKALHREDHRRMSDGHFRDALIMRIEVLEENLAQSADPARREAIESELNQLKKVRAELEASDNQLR
jgi:beta-lactamase regulating signal transducer with metallopeptidase domain